MNKTAKNIIYSLLFGLSTFLPAFMSAQTTISSGVKENTGFFQETCKDIRENNEWNSLTGKIDTGFFNQIKASCKKNNNQNIEIDGSLKDIITKALDIENQKLFELVFSLLPRDITEVNEFRDILGINLQRWIKRLEGSGSELSKYLLIRFYYERITSNAYGSEVEANKSKMLTLVNSWNSDNLQLTGYVDAWSYFALERDTGKLSKELVDTMDDIRLYKRSMKMNWYTKEALKDLRNQNKKGFGEDIKKLSETLKELQGLKFTGFFSRGFYNEFDKNPEFLSTEYFSQRYINFVKGINRIKKLTPETTTPQDIQYIEDIMEIGNLENLKSDPVLRENIFGQYSLLTNSLVPILYSYARRDFSTIEGLIEKYPNFFSMGNFQEVENTIKMDAQRAKNGPAPVIEGFIKTPEKTETGTVTPVIKASEGGNTSLKTYAMGILYGLIIFSIIIISFYAVSGKNGGGNIQKDSQRNNR